MPVLPAADEGLFFLFFLALTLYGLIWINRRLHQRLYQFLLLCTGSSQFAMLGLFLLFLPGIVLHESTHWVVAYALRLKPHSFTLWPKLRDGKTLEMGSVQMKGAGIWRETLVGMAPLVAGSAVTALIGARVFGLHDLILHLLRLQPLEGLRLIRTAFAAPDSALWLYLVFAVGNTMLPSASDRRSLRPVFYYLGLGILLFALVDFLSTEVSGAFWLNLLNALTYPLQILSSFLLLVIMLDLVLLSLLGLYSLLVDLRRQT